MACSNPPPNAPALTLLCRSPPPPRPPFPAGGGGFLNITELSQATASCASGVISELSDVVWGCWGADGTLTNSTKVYAYLAAKCLFKPSCTVYAHSGAAHIGDDPCGGVRNGYTQELLQFV